MIEPALACGVNLGPKIKKGPKSNLLRLIAYYTEDDCDK